MGTYEISTKEFLEGHIHPSVNKGEQHYMFEDFLRDFEGNVSAETLADAWNKLAKLYGWKDLLEVKK